MEERPDVMGGPSADETTSMDRLTAEQVVEAAEALAAKEAQEAAGTGEPASAVASAAVEVTDEAGEASEEQAAAAEESAQGAAAVESPVRKRAKKRPVAGKGAKRRRRRKPGSPYPLLLALFVALLSILMLGAQCHADYREAVREKEAAEAARKAEEAEAQAAEAARQEQEAKKSSWELTLVNKNHPIPADWQTDVVEIGEERYIDSRIAEQLQKMVDDCAAAGYDDVFINEAYRSHERQQEIWDTTYQEYLAEGYSEEEAYELTGQSVAVPGTSEHELGLAADICSVYFDEEYNAPIQTWLRENGWQYGFIQRYPEGKEDITGTKNENWHFRYVGVEAAKEMHDSGQTLEEYLGEVDLNATSEAVETSE